MLFLSLVSPVFSHTPGQPPFVKINDTYLNLYHVSSSSLLDFELPEDSAPEEYIVNQPLTYEIDFERLPVPKEIVDKSTFTWEFGNGEKREGKKVTYRYNTPGSYITKVYAYEPSMPERQQLESTMVHIKPTKDFVLPKVYVVINKEKITDPLTQTLSVSFSDTFSFDYSFTKVPPSEVASIFWDFGDQKTSTKKENTHIYDQKLRMVFPLVRIKDTDGFIYDNYAQITNQAFDNQKNFLQKTPSTNKPPQNSPSQLPWIIGIVCVVILLLILRKFFFKKK